MKTTLNISNNIFLKTKALARKEKVTIRELVEEGLELVISKHSMEKPYKAKPVIFKGKGLSKKFQNSSWEKIRDAAYEGHGS